MKQVSRHLFAFLALGLAYAVGAATQAGVPGMVLAAIQAQFNWSASQTALISSMGVFGCMVFLPLAGWAVDRFGWLRLAFLGILLQVVGGGWMACGNPYFLHAGAFVNGGGRTIVYLSIFKLLDVGFARQAFAWLLGLFYLFSYGGNWLGSWGFAHFAGWQTLFQIGNAAALVLGLCVLAVFVKKVSLRRCGVMWGRRDVLFHADAPPATPPSPAEAALWTAPVLFALLATAVSILVYWTFLTVGARPYLEAFYGGDLAPLHSMNTLVVIGMVGGAPVCSLLGNRYRTFQVAGLVCVFGALIGLACGGVWLGFIGLGVGYGMTAIQICALRASVPSAYSARMLALANFIANIGRILFTQLIGYLYDKAA